MTLTDHPEEIRAGGVFRIGHPIELVTWRLVGEGWTARTVAGVYDGHTGTDWLLTINGTQHRYPRNQWEACLA